ncbi:unnamed protein product [marine sediment metagenome]|uniref:Uncharacterized protein n=1 Tax=marine sediment metagenome TaxID=412755 RepID=X1L903_9ZZZZ
MKDAQFPKIKTVDLAMHPKVIDSRLIKKDGKIDFSKADGKKVTAKIVEKDMRLKKAGVEYKIKEVKDTFKGLK